MSCASVIRRLLPAAAAAGLLTIAPPVDLLMAQESPKPDAEAAAAEEAIEIPEGPAEKLLEFIVEQQTTRPTARTREEFISKLTRSQKAVLEAAERVLKTDSLTDDQFQQAAEAKFVALGLLGQLGEPQAIKQALAFAAQLKQDKRPKVASMATRQSLLLRTELIAGAPEAEQTALIKELAEFLGKEVSRQRFGIAMRAASTLEQSGNTEMAAKAYRTFAGLIADSEDEALASYGPKIEGAARRITLPGKFMDLNGETADGQKFDWKSYRGKVVLVDFWATWCGPCIQELPNVKQNYAAYHDRGFEVVGVNLDTNKNALEKFVVDREIPWVNLFSSNAETQGWDHPMATHYGVMGIPTAILVDKEGKVVSLNARGPELTGLLEELLGPPAETPSKKPAGDE